MINLFIHVRHELLTAVGMKVIVFWDVNLGGRVEIYRHFAENFPPPHPPPSIYTFTRTQGITF
jgi:hypothetical protein